MQIRSVVLSLILYAAILNMLSLDAASPERSTIRDAAFDTGAIARVTGGNDAYGHVFDIIHQVAPINFFEDIRIIENPAGQAVALLIKKDTSICVLSLSRYLEDQDIHTIGRAEDSLYKLSIIKINKSSCTFSFINKLFDRFAELTVNPDDLTNFRVRTIMLSPTIQQEETALTKISSQHHWVAYADNNTKKVNFAKTIPGSAILSISLKADESIIKVAFDSNEKFLLVLTNKLLRLINLETLTIALALEHTSEKPWAKFNYRGTRVIYSHRPAEAKIVSVNGTMVEEWTREKYPSLTIARGGFVSADDHVLIDRSNNSCSVWAEPYHTGHIINHELVPIKSVRTSAALGKIAVLREDNIIEAQSYDGSYTITLKPSKSSTVTSFEINDDRGQLVTAADDKIVKIFNIDTGRQLAALQLLEVPRTLRCHKDHIVFQDAAKHIHIFDTSFLSFSPEQQAFTLIAYDQQIKNGKFDFRAVPGVTERELKAVYESFLPRIQKLITRYINLIMTAPAATPLVEPSAATASSPAEIAATTAEHEDDPAVTALAHDPVA